jgi:hypothetical protein
VVGGAAAASSQMGEGENNRDTGEGGQLAEDLKVFRRVECMSPDFIRQMQTKSITKFKWDP